MISKILCTTQGEEIKHMVYTMKCTQLRKLRRNGGVVNCLCPFALRSSMINMLRDHPISRTNGARFSLPRDKRAPNIPFSANLSQCCQGDEE
jgi:hypothetical protein